MTQEFGSLAPVQVGLAQDIRHRSVMALNRVLAHTMALRDLYKKAHWQASGSTFFELHLLFDKHYEEQARLMDEVAERVQTLGGVARPLAMEIGALGDIGLSRSRSCRRTGGTRRKPTTSG